MVAALVGVPVTLSRQLSPAGWLEVQPARAAAVSRSPATDFQLMDTDGSPVKLSDYKGKQSVLLYFWATWCQACMAVRPQVAKLRSQIGRDKVEILGINVGEGDSLERVVLFQKGHPAPYPILYDDGSKVSKAYRVQGIPAFILIDKEGYVVYRDFRPPSDITRYLEEQ
jgi:peroxiredoxin